MTFDESEGATPLDPDEKQGLKFPHITTRGELNELEQANIEQGIAWVSHIGINPFHIGVQLRILLDNARYWENNDVFPPLEAAARFHHRMVQIHLFPNGNGRHARIAADILLEEVYDHPPVAWASGFDLQADNERRNAYISALRAADGGDFEPLLAFVGVTEVSQTG